MLKISLRSYLIASILIVLGFIILVMHLTPKMAAPAMTNTALVEESMEGVSAYRFDDQGRLYQVVKMQSWLHYKGAEISQMLVPSLKVYHPDGSIWHIAAQTGESFHSHLHSPIEKIQLSRNVVVDRQMLHSEGWLKLTTQILTFFPNQPLATTNEPVVVESPQLKIHAQGMRAHLDRQAIEFLKDVKSSYAPKV